MSDSTIPTSGTYTGLYIYQEQPIPAQFDALIDDVNAATGLDLAGQIAILGNAVASDATVTFGSGTVTYGSDDEGASGTIAYDGIGRQGSQVFEADGTDGSTYVVSNVDAAATIALSLDAALTALSTELTNLGNPIGATAVDALKAAIDTAGLGSTLVLTSNDDFTGTYAPPCFARGTRIGIPGGFVPVEQLQAGDRVALADGGEARVKWVGHRRVRLDQPGLAALAPVRVSAGSLGAGLPLRDLVVSPDHALFVDGVLIPAGLLVDEMGIRREHVAAVDYFHVELPAHALLIAEGTPAESYRDTGNRSRFANARLVELRPTPVDFASAAEITDGVLCAPLVLGGERLARVRAMIAAFRPAALRAAS